MAPDSKTNTFSDTASIATSSDSIRDEKERNQQAGQPKESLTRKVINAIKKIEPPEPRIPEGKHEHLPAWAR
ncbi:hypothetical protein LTR84_011733 [Exophiala bonariae]|uniref:Uncharacterized protein n=1 Tax=Exophiala bonariae TaxID=1690606 RepID=A0AAV9NH96_9EURO|nr:hypothetical protein LTR84_011733 [Exophiala bonariae]